MFGAWITEVYEAARRAWDLSNRELAEISRSAVRASFADHAVRAEIERGIDDWLAVPVSR